MQQGEYTALSDRRSYRRDNRDGRDSRDYRNDRRKRSSRSPRRSHGNKYEERKRSRSPSPQPSQQPPVKKERKRKSLFDVTPEEMVRMGIQQFASGEASLGASMFNTVGVGNTNPTSNPTQLVQQRTFIPPSQQTPQQKQARRIYVGNLPRDTTEQEMIQFFNDAMRRLNIMKIQGDAVVGAQINYEKNFVFLDFRTPEEATAAMSLDGIKMRDQLLKVRRPNNYVSSTSQGELYQKANIPGLVSTNVPDSENKLFIGGLPAQMSEETVLQLLNNIGTLNAFNLVKDVNSGLSKGYAFCEFASDEATDKAIQLLNGVEMGGKKLLVQRASVGKQGQASSTTSEKVQDPQQSAIHNLLNMNVRIDQALAGLVSSGDAKIEPTNVLVLYNLVTLRDLVEDDYYRDLCRDIEAEASKYGNVKSLVIPQPDNREKNEYARGEGGDAENAEIYPFDDHHKGIGKILIEFENVEQAERAQQELAGRKYQGRTCITSFHDVNDFYNKKYT
jgi:splicing factor U2AF subunit